MNKIYFEYDKSVIESNQIFIENKSQIEKFGIIQFMKDIGIFIEFVPLYKHPNSGGGLIGFQIDNMEYRLNKMIDENTYEMEKVVYYKTFPTISDASTTALLKAFEIINENSYFKDRIKKLY